MEAYDLIFFPEETGRGGNRFIPDETATRAEAVAILLRMLEYKED
ncbi:hypothetical protein [Brevibacillus ruminantium]|nr:hypothetical protein [Brevibacillus ruminantium]